MDEFDVFMDADSRNHAMCEILNFAEKHRSRQFILITPQVRRSFFIVSWKPLSFVFYLFIIFIGVF